MAACLAWSGDVLQAQLDNPYLKFVIPEEGLMIWSDSMIVPTASSQADAVARLAAYFYHPVVAAKVAAWVNYICPVVGAQEAMERIDPDLALSPLIFPDTTILDRSYQFAIAAGRGRPAAAQVLRLARHVTSAGRGGRASDQARDLGT